MEIWNNYLLIIITDFYCPLDFLNLGLHSSYFQPDKYFSAHSKEGSAALPVFAFSLENGPEVHQVEESWPKLNYSNVTLLPTMVIPTPLVQEYKTATEGCKKTYKHMHSIPELPWGRGAQLLFAQNTPPEVQTH